MRRSDSDREETTSCGRSGAAGATLLEVLFATIFISGVVIGMALFFTKAAASYVHYKTRNVANNTANSAMQVIKAKPYTIVPLTPAGPSVGTPGAYFLAGPNGNCDCNNVDFTQFPNQQTVTNGKTTYYQSTCINLIDRTASGAWYAYCPGTIKDTGLKNVVVNVRWNIENVPQSYTQGSLVSQNKQRPVALNTGSVVVSVCKQVAGGPIAAAPFIFTSPQANWDTYCDKSLFPALQNPDIVGSEVAIYNAGQTTLVDNGGVLPTPTQITLPVPPGGPYTVHVQQVSPSGAAFFPFHIDLTQGGALSVSAGTTYYVYAYLRLTTDFGSKLTGEVFRADHPVISKVIDAYAQPNGCDPVGAPAPGICDNASEALEIYNPTGKPFQIRCGSNPNCLQVQYCDIYNNCTSAFDFSDVLHFQVNQNTLSPNSYLAIVGKDTRAGAGIPAEWPQTPDVVYDVGDPALQVP